MTPKDKNTVQSESDLRVSSEEKQQTDEPADKQKSSEKAANEVTNAKEALIDKPQDNASQTSKNSAKAASQGS